MTHSTDNVHVGTMHCRLCLCEAELCDSHIIPEFFYSRLYDEKHRFVGISNDPDRAERYFQKGIREKLLCKKCERRFSVHENYARGVFFGGKEIQTSYQPQRMLIEGLDYAAMRFFELSLLWRMGISEELFFSDVRLGPFEEDIRNKLVTDNCGDPSEYRCTITGLLFKGEPMPVFVAPDRVKLHGQTCYRVIITGFLFMFFVSKQPIPVEVMEHLGKEDGTRSIHVAELRDIPFLRAMFLGLSEAMNKRPPHFRKK